MFKLTQDLPCMNSVVSSSTSRSQWAQDFSIFVYIESSKWETAGIFLEVFEGGNPDVHLEPSFNALFVISLTRSSMVVVTGKHHHSIAIHIRSIWVNYNNSLNWIKAIWGWFPLLTMIPVRSQWGCYNLPRYIHLPPQTQVFGSSLDGCHVVIDCRVWWAGDDGIHGLEDQLLSWGWWKFQIRLPGGQRKMLHRNPMAYKLHPTYQQKNPSRLVKYGEIQPIFLGFLTMGIPGYP